MHWKKFLAASMTTLFLFGANVSYFHTAYANLEEDAANQNVKVQIEKENVNEKIEKRKNIAADLDSIQFELKEVTKEYEAADEKLITVENQITSNEEKLTFLHKNLEIKNKVLSKRMRDIYKNGQVNYLDVLLGATDFSDFANRAHLLKRVLNQDITLITEIKEEQLLVEQITAQLEEDRVYIETIKTEAQKKKDLIIKQKELNEHLLQIAEEEEEASVQMYEQELAKSREIEEMIRQAKVKPQPTRPSPQEPQEPLYQQTPQATGALVWPAPSTYITSSFGYRTHPVFGGTRFHSGVDIAADYGDPIVAADSGTVIYSDWMSGYGYTVIIDHGNGISTLYAHNSNLHVSNGQYVNKGQHISSAGSTGYSTGPHLHFEVRQNGSPTDPQSYF